MNADERKARLGPWSDPFAVLIYGPIGTGKSAQITACLGDKCVVIGPPGGTKGGRSVFGANPKVRHVAHLGEVGDIVNRIAALPIEKRPDIAIDDISTLGQNWELVLRQDTNLFDGYGNAKGSGSFRFWELLVRPLTQLRDARMLGVHVVATAHEIPQSETKGRIDKGGPRFPKKDATQILPAYFDTVVYTEALPGRDLWPMVYYRAHPQWLGKDRHEVFFDPAPANMAEGLRAAGYDIQYPDPKIGRYVEQIAAAILDRNLPTNGPDFMTFVLGVGEKIREKQFSWPQVRWIIQDARDRVELLRVKDSPSAWLPKATEIVIPGIAGGEDL